MRRTNAFTKIPKAELEQMIAEARSIATVFKRLRLNITGGQYTIFKATMKDLGIDIGHLGSNHPAGPLTLIPTEVMFAANTHHSCSTLKWRITRDALKPYVCEGCKNEGIWMGKEITLQLDHIDGDRYNNTLTNLRFLCPNCHSQTPTHSRGGDRLKKQVEDYTCTRCEEPYAGYGAICRACADKERGAKRIAQSGWPSVEEMARLVWEKTLNEIGKQYERTGAGVKAFCKRNDISIPPMGYWLRRKAGYTHEQSLTYQKPVLAAPFPHMVREQWIEAKRLMDEGYSMRQAAKAVGVGHGALSHRMAKHRRGLEQTFSARVVVPTPAKG